MQVVVKMPPIRLEGEIPENLVEYLRNEFGDISIESDDYDLIEFSKSDWYKEFQPTILPGENLCFYREQRGLTQTQLGAMLGNMSRQYISNLENGHRSISKTVAKKLAEIFNVPVGEFI